MRKLATVSVLVGSLAGIALTPSVAAAQIVVVPPRVIVHAPPVWVPAPRVVRFVRWQRPRVRVVVVPAAPPPPVVYAPPPPVEVYPPPPVYVQPAPVYVPPRELPPIPPPIVAPPPAVYVQPAPVVYAPAPAKVVVATPAFRSQFGLGLRGSGVIESDKFHGLGIGGELLWRISPHVGLEVAGEYQRNTSGPTARMDIPLTLGVRIQLSKPTWVVSPYLVAALGADIATQNLKVLDERAYFFEGQAGGGLEVRLGRHVALTADARFVGRYRVDAPAPEVASLRSVDGKPVAPMGNQYGGQFRLGFDVYF